MPEFEDDRPVFPVGSTVVRRDVLRGRVWSASPNRVIHDDGDHLVLGCWPGVRLLAPTSWIEWLQTGDPAARRQAIPNLVACPWELGAWSWQETTLITQLHAGDYCPTGAPAPGSTPSTCFSTWSSPPTCPGSNGRTRTSTRRPAGSG